MNNKFIKFIFIQTLAFSFNSFAAKTEEVILTASSTDSVLTLESMAVTAEVTDSKLGGIDVKTLPFASTIINQDEIKRLKYVAPDEILDRIPGESQTRNLRIPVGGKSYTIPLVDGAALTSPLRGSTQAFSDSVNSQDIERIEIFKGPTSALFPNNAFGGVVNVVSKGSSQLPEQNTRFWGEAGTFNRYRGGASTQGEFKNVGYLFDYSGWNLEHYRDEGELSSGRIFETGEERQQASAKFIFHPDEVSSLVVRGSYLMDHLADPGEIFESDFNTDDKGIGRNTGFFSDAETFLGSGIYKRDFTDADHLEANFTFIYLDTAGFSRFTGENEDIAFNVNGKVSYKHDFDFWDTNLIIGTDIFQGIEDDFNPARTSRGRPVLADFDYATTDIYAGFAQLQFSPLENLQITAGVRHESIDLNHTNTTLAGNNTRNNASFSATLPKVGISYDFFDAHRLWFAYGEGFLVPTNGQLYTGRGNNPNLNPEEADHFEVGLRGSLPLFDSELTYDTSYYYQDIDQFIVINDLNSRDVNTNAGKVNIQGVETVIEYQPFDFIRFGITHTFATSIYKQYIDNNGVDLSGEELNHSPEHHVNGRVAVMPLEGLAIEVGVDSVSSYSTIDNSSLDPKGRYSRDERINLRLTYDKGPYELWFHALNLADIKEDRVSYNTRGRQRSVRTVDGLQVYGGIAYNF